MNVHTQTEKPSPSFEQLKAQYERGNIGQQAVIRSAIAMQTIVDSGLDRSVKVDAVMACLKALVLDLEVGTYERLLMVTEKTGIPLDVVMAKATLLACDLGDASHRKLSNIMELFIDELNKRESEQKTAEVVS